MTNNATTISLRHITKHFGGQVALDSVSLSIKPGCVLGLLGENGAGKTTLLRILGGTLEQDSGEVLFDDAVVNAQTRRRQTAVLYGGNAGLYDDLSVSENILYFAKLRGMSSSAAAESLQELTNRFSMTNYLDKKACELSTGMRQKTAIVRALIHDPSIILFDEPDSGLDFSATGEINSFLSDCARAGKTVVVSSHSAGDILALCDTITLLHHGNLGLSYGIADLMQGKSFREAYIQLHRMVGRH